MMNNPNLDAPSARAQWSWSNRVLLLALAGIFFLTLYPFRFEHQESARFLFPFSLDGWGKGTNVLDIFLNILLFIPFGFGLAEKLGERGKSKKATLLAVYIAGALLSYFVEFLQIYIPQRDSGWGDVFTNSFGALIGAWIFVAAGAGIIAWFNARERELNAWLTFPKIGVFVGLYIAFWCALVGPLQTQARMSNWTPDSYLAVGDYASLYPGSPWKGRVFELDIWDHAIPREFAQILTGKVSANTQPALPLAAYVFSGPAPFHDIHHFLPDLDWASQAPDSGDHAGAVFDGRSWLISTGGVPMLVRSVEHSGQFALRVVCQPANTIGADARIISISSPSGAVNMELGQSGSALEFWFRNPLSMRRSRMTWKVPRVFSSAQIHNLLLSFNGTALSLYVDGREYTHPYELGPAVALARYIRHVKTAELAGYKIVFNALIFFPAGCLLGFAWRRSDVRYAGRTCFLLAACIISAGVLEWFMAHMAGRAMSFRDIGLSALLALFASFWINADCNSAGAMRSDRQPVSVR